MFKEDNSAQEIPSRITEPHLNTEAEIITASQVHQSMMQTENQT